MRFECQRRIWSQFKNADRMIDAEQNIDERQEIAPKPPAPVDIGRR